MNTTVKIDDFTIEAEQFTRKDEGEQLKISFAFKVRSEDYHDVTSLLYKDDFVVEVPDENLKFPAIINNYSTSITNLYEENKVGNFELELVEKRT